MCGPGATAPNPRGFDSEKKISKRRTCLSTLAGVEGIEPSSGVLETLILPMNYTPIFMM